MDIKWSAPEFHYHDKDVSWYWLVILISLAFVGLALWQENFLFAVFIVVACLLVITWGRREPNTIDFTLSETGLDIGGKKFYSYADLAGFVIIPDNREEELAELVLKTKNLLSHHLPEIEYEESLTEHIARWLRF